MTNSERGKYSKSKGKRFERAIANYFKERGYNTRRSAQYCGKTGEAADVVGLPDMHIECKDVEKLNIRKAMEQATNDCMEHNDKTGDSLVPVVIHHQKRYPTLVTMYLDDWTALYMASHDPENSSK